MLVACVLYSIQALLVFVILIARGRVGELGLALYIFAIVGIVISLTGSMFVWMSNRVSRALYGRGEERSWLSAIRSCLAATSLGPLGMLLTYWALNILPPPPFALWASGVASLLLPVALILISRQAAVEIQHDEEWAVLEIEA